MDDGACVNKNNLCYRSMRFCNDSTRILNAITINIWSKKMARVAKKAVVKKGAVKKAANKSVRKTSARNPVATLTKSHAAAEKKVVAAQKKLDKLTAAREKITVKLTAAIAKAEAKAAKAAPTN